MTVHATMDILLKEMDTRVLVRLNRNLHSNLTQIGYRDGCLIRTCAL